MTNYDALLTLIGDINNAFCHLEDEDVADICDGDMRLLDKAVKRFKTTVWEKPNIEFDFSDSQGELDEWEQEQIVKNNIGVWEADDEDDLIDEITTGTGGASKA